MKPKRNLVQMALIAVFGGMETVSGGINEIRYSHLWKGRTDEDETLLRWVLC
jgi:hypothetical protein